MFVKCIDNNKFEELLTLGQIYQVIGKIKDNMYIIKTDKNFSMPFNISRFE